MIIDDPIGDPDILYAQWEFSLGGSWCCFMEELAPNLYNQWVTRMDENGDFSPADGRRVLIAPNISKQDYATWGYDASGPFMAGLNQDKFFYVASPQTGIQVFDTPDTDPFFDDPAQRQNRKNTLVSKYLGARVFCYHWHDQDTHRLYLVDAANPIVHQEIYIEPDVHNGGVSATTFSVQRFLDGELALIHGHYETPDTEFADVRMVTFDLANLADFTGTRVTTDARSKIDPFPFVYEGQRAFLAGLDNEPTGGLYLWDDTTSQYLLSQEINTPVSQSTLIQPAGAFSFEVARWGQGVYASYHIYDGALGNRPFQAPGEIWFTRLGNESAWRIGGLPGLAAADPEPIAAGTEFRVYYASCPAQHPPTQCEIRKVTITPNMLL